MAAQVMAQRLQAGSQRAFNTWAGLGNGQQGLGFKRYTFLPYSKRPYNFVAGKVQGTQGLYQYSKITAPYTMAVFISFTACNGSKAPFRLACPLQILYEDILAAADAIKVRTALVKPAIPAFDKGAIRFNNTFDALPAFKDMKSYTSIFSFIKN